MTKTPDQFGGDMLRIRRAAAIAADEDFSAGTQGGNEALALGQNVAFKGVERVDGSLMLLNVYADKGHSGYLIN